MFLGLDRTSVVIGQRSWNVKYLLYFLTCWSALRVIKAAFKQERNYNFPYVIKHARKKTTYVSSKESNVHLLIKSNLADIFSLFKSMNTQVYFSSVLAALWFCVRFAYFCNSPCFSFLSHFSPRSQLFAIGC